MVESLSYVPDLSQARGTKAGEQDILAVELPGSKEALEDRSWIDRGIAALMCPVLN